MAVTSVARRFGPSIQKAAAAKAPVAPTAKPATAGARPATLPAQGQGGGLTGARANYAASFSRAAPSAVGGVGKPMPAQSQGNAFGRMLGGVSGGMGNMVRGAATGTQSPQTQALITRLRALMAARQGGGGGSPFVQALLAGRAK